MSVDAREVFGDEWTRLQGLLINGVFPLGRFLGGSERGGVFQTRSRQPGHPDVAIKLCPARDAGTDLDLERWERAGALSHPHLLTLLEAGTSEIDGLPYRYLVMEYADQTLEQLLTRRALTAEEAYEMLPPTLEALAFLHRQDLVHGGLKPANILVVGDRLKLASDTIRDLHDDARDLRGHSAYAPPECHDGHCSRAGDIWALGVTLLEALTRRAPMPFRGGNRDSIVLPADFPPALRDPVARCLRPVPQGRPSATELLARIGGRTAHSPGDTAARAQAPDRPGVQASQAIALPDAPPASPASVTAAPPDATPPAPDTARPDAYASPSALDFAPPGGDAKPFGLAGTAVTVDSELLESTSPAADSMPPADVAPTTEDSMSPPAPVATPPADSMPSAVEPAPMTQDSLSQPADVAALTAKSMTPAADPAPTTQDSVPKPADVAALTAKSMTPAADPAPTTQDSVPKPADVAPPTTPSVRPSVDATPRANVTPIAHDSAPIPSFGAAIPKPLSRRTVLALAAALVLGLCWAGLRGFEAGQSTTAAVTQGPEGENPSIAADTSSPKGQPRTPGTPASSVDAVGKDATSPSATYEYIPKVAQRAARSIHGHVKVSVRTVVKPDGSVSSAAAERGSGTSRYFQRLAVNAAKKWTFAPLPGGSSRAAAVVFDFSRDGTTAHAVATR